MALIHSDVAAERKIRLLIESRLEDVPLVGLAIRGLLKDAVADAVLLYQIEVAVVEAVNNVIKHAYGLEADHDVEITVSLRPDFVLFMICDTGETKTCFDPVGFQFDPRDIAHLPENGMGIPLMKNIMDEVSYGRRDEKNCLTLRKCL